MNNLPTHQKCLKKLVAQVIILMKQNLSLEGQEQECLNVIFRFKRKAHKNKTKLVKAKMIYWLQMKT